MFKKSSFVKIIFCVFVLLQGLRLTAQTDKEFWFVAPEVTINHYYPGGTPAFLKFSTSNKPATVTISMPAADSAVFPDIVFNMPANSFHYEDLTCWVVNLCAPPIAENFNPVNNGLYYDVDLLENKPLTPDGINNFGIHITSTDSITAYYEVSRRNNKDIWALKGKNALGKEFYTPFQDNKANQTLAATAPPLPPTTQPYSSIDIVATEDFTDVTFYLTKAASYGTGPETDKLPGSIFTIPNLMRGQTFSLFTKDTLRTAASRLTGVRIVSNNNIAVTIKDDSFFHTRGTCYDLAGDQLVPTSIIGKEYVVIRTNLYKPLNNDPNPSPV